MSTAMASVTEGAVVVLTKHRDRLSTLDLSLDEDFEEALDVVADYKAGAPPCKSFSQARRQDHVAHARVLRSDARPQGFGCMVTKAANLLADRMAEIGATQVRLDRFFSIEIRGGLGCGN